MDVWKREPFIFASLQDDLSEPLFEEDVDGSAGVLFPFYDPDTQMLYLAGKVRKTLHMLLSCPNLITRQFHEMD